MMDDKKAMQMSETLRIGCILAISGGFLESYSFLTRGGVFANAQTGNMALLAMHAVQGDWATALRYLVPIAAFAAGVLAAEGIRRRFPPNRQVHWRQIVLAVEAALLFVVAYLPAPKADTAACVLISFVCALQVQTFRKVRGGVYASTMCTGNLRSGTEQLWLYAQTKKPEHEQRARVYFTVIGAFIFGAAVGCLCTDRFGVTAVLGAIIFQIAALVLMR